MLFLKKLFLGFGALFLIFAGGSGTQSNNLLLQGGGFVGIVVGLAVLYIFGKMVWRAMGCIPMLLVFGLIAGFIMYAIGAFNNGIESVIPNIQSFLGNSVSGYTAQQENAVLQIEEAPLQNAGLLQENFGEQIAPSPTPVVDGFAPPPSQLQQPVAAAPIQTPPTQLPPVQLQPQKLAQESGFSKFISSLTGAVQQQPSQPAVNSFNPNNYPAVRFVAKVINGDTLEARGRYFRLFGIDAPESNQTCADSKGRAYSCGQESARWLKSWISGQEIECRVVQQDASGNMVGPCAIGQYDIAAALVNAGWAVAYTKATGIYLPYEIQAKENGRGLWQGQFYMPWDWREIQSKKPKIKIIRPKQPKKSLLDL